MQSILNVLGPGYEVGGHVLQMTAHIGVSRFREDGPKDGCELAQLLGAADAAVYEAKCAGRDGVRMHPQAASEMAGEPPAV